MKFNSQLNMSGREPTTCDTPVSHSIDIPTEKGNWWCYLFYVIFFYRCVEDTMVSSEQPLQIPSLSAGGSGVAGLPSKDTLI